MFGCPMDRRAIFDCYNGYPEVQIEEPKIGGLLTCYKSWCVKLGERINDTLVKLMTNAALAGTRSLVLNGLTKRTPLKALCHALKFNVWFWGVRFENLDHKLTDDINTFVVTNCNITSMTLSGLSNFKFEDFFAKVNVNEGVGMTMAELSIANNRINQA